MDAVEEEQFRAFVVSMWPALLRTAYLLTGDHHHAEDLVQSALVRTHRYWRRIQRTDAPEVYVRRVLVSLNANRWRRRRVIEHVTDAVPEPSGVEAPTLHLREEIWHAAQRLPAQMRAVLVLRYFEDLSVAEVAGVLGCSEGTVKSQASRGLARLRAELTSHDLITQEETA
jgi:RNA polymerase sigma-70 factor (sigma-E family)